MSDLHRRSVLIGAALAPIAVAPIAPYARADPGPLSADLIISVSDYGAVGDGTTDDTIAIETALAASPLPDSTIYFPPGRYVYTGLGLLFDGSRKQIRVIGAAMGASTIILGSSSYFIHCNGLLTSMVLRDMNFEGGKGAVAHTFTGDNVKGTYLIQNCRFKNYTECAIASDANDMPYWKIRDCYFDAANTTGGIGIALGQGSDGSVIDSCDFYRGRIGIKLRRGNNVVISSCSWACPSPDNSGGPRIAIWVVPFTSPANAGDGFKVLGCRFGNENLVAGDLRVLFADAQPGATNGVQLPELNADSAGYMQGAIIANSTFIDNSNDAYPMVYSTTPNVRWAQIHHNFRAGFTDTSHVIRFRTAPAFPDRLNSTNVFGPDSGLNYTEQLTPPASNAEGIGYWQDPQGFHQRSNTIRNWSSGSSPSFKEVLSVPTTSFTEVSSSKSNVTDAYGGADAVVWTMASGSATLSCTLTREFIVGMPTWVEFDVSSPQGGNPAAEFSVSIREVPSVFHWRRVIAVPAAGDGWVSYAFCFAPRTTGQGQAKIVFAATGESEAERTVNLGRTRVYQANERQIGGARPAVVGAATSERDAVILVNDLRDKLIALGLVTGMPSADRSVYALPGIAPPTSNATGTAGQIAWDSRYLYVCTDTDTWRRVAIGEDSW